MLYKCLELFNCGVKGVSLSFLVVPWWWLQPVVTIVQRLRSIPNWWSSRRNILHETKFVLSRSHFWHTKRTKAKFTKHNYVDIDLTFCLSFSFYIPAVLRPSLPSVYSLTLLHGKIKLSYINIFWMWNELRNLKRNSLCSWFFFSLSPSFFAPLFCVKFFLNHSFSF